MDASTDLHTEDQMETADTPNPFELDYTPSMRQVGTGPQYRSTENAVAGTLSSSAHVANAGMDFNGGGAAAPSSSLGDEGEQVSATSVPESQEFQGITTEIFDRMSNSEIAELVAKTAGICSAGCIASLRDVDFKGHWGDEAYLTANIGSKVNFMDHMLVMAALSQMHEFFAKSATFRPSHSPPPPLQVKSYLSELLSRVVSEGVAAVDEGLISPLGVMEQILQQPEYIFEKPSYDKYHKSRLPQQPLPGYPPAIIPADIFLLIVNSFIETYPDINVGETDYVQKLSIEPDAELRIMGDLHGCAQAFVRMLVLLMSEGFIDGGLRLTGQNSYMVFLGDFVDYGRNGCETLALMMLCRSLNPQRVLVCRGNHEDCSIYARPEYGFLLELQQRYGDQIGPLRAAIDASFERMPLAIFAGIKGHPESGFAQLCHGGLEIDSSTIDSFQRMLSSPADPSRCCVSSQSSSRCNLQWGDFSGVAIHGGVASSSRGYTHDIEGTKAAIARLGVRCVFRGHQDHLHAAKNLVETFKEPVCLVPVEVPQVDALKPFAPWLSDNAASLEQLRYQGLRIGSLPPFIGPVFTFSNASSCRANYDEGFGMLTMASSWEDCVVRYRIYRPEAFTVRASVFAGSTLYLPDDLARAIDGGGGIESGDAPRTLSWTAVMPAFLNPHFTSIDSEGNANVCVLPKQVLPPIESTSPTSPSSPTLSVPESFSRAFLARYHQVDGVNIGMSARFIEKVLAGDFVCERQEERRKHDWLKSDLQRQQTLRQCDEDQIQRKRAAEAQSNPAPGEILD